MTCLGKSTLLRSLGGKTLNGNEIHSTFLEYSKLREELPIFANKFGNVYLETMYTAVHLMRTLAIQQQPIVQNPDAKMLLQLTDRMPLANFVFDFLFVYEGQRCSGRIVDLLRDYDQDPSRLTREDRERVRAFDASFALFADELKKICPKYHTMFVLADDEAVEQVAERLCARDSIDPAASFDVRSYIASQNCLFRRAATVMGERYCSVVAVEKFVTSSQLLAVVDRVYPEFSGGRRGDGRLRAL